MKNREAVLDLEFSSVVPKKNRGQGMNSLKTWGGDGNGGRGNFRWDGGTGHRQ